jgi:hypothetical protein
MCGGHIGKLWFLGVGCTRSIPSQYKMRDLLKSHLLKLLHNQNVYWKQRGKIKWVKLGNENTKFFHTKATINYRHNFIAMLKNED